MSEVWNNVTVYGRADEIDRFRRLCIDAPEATYTDGQFGWDGCECTIHATSYSGRSSTDCVHGEDWEYVWNFQHFFQDDEISYSFSFDTNRGFPEQLFGAIASRFPHLTFDCACIDSMDASMGFGWFNPLPGGEKFRQDYNVPRNFWTSRNGFKRAPMAQTRHDARIARLKQVVRGTSI